MLYKFDIQCIYETEYWTNTWYYLCDNAGDAILNAQDLGAKYVELMNDPVVVDKVRITPTPFLRDTFTEVIIGENGTANANPPAPLFNCARMVSTVGVGRGTQHYVRGCVSPGNIGGDQKFTPGAVAFYNTIALALITLDHGNLATVHGQLVTGMITSPLVGMRQLRRGSKRKHTPVI